MILNQLYFRFSLIFFEYYLSIKSTSHPYKFEVLHLLSIPPTIDLNPINFQEYEQKNYNSRFHFLSYTLQEYNHHFLYTRCKYYIFGNFQVFLRLVNKKPPLTILHFQRQYLDVSKGQIIILHIYGLQIHLLVLDIFFLILYSILRILQEFLSRILGVDNQIHKTFDNLWRTCEFSQFTPEF